MNWDYFNLLKKHEEEKKSSALKAVLITVGVVAAVAAAAVVVYTIFKKYFTITFECDDCDWAAMQLRGLFQNQSEESYDTYILNDCK